MKLGQNQELVQEVFDFFESQQLRVGILMGELPIDATPFEIEEDLKQAAVLSNDQDVVNYGDSVWRAIHDWLISPVMYSSPPVTGRYEHRYGAFADRCKTFQDRFMPSFLDAAKETGVIDGPYVANALVANICEDYRDIAYVRYRRGTDHPFYELLFSAYKQGGWPCGWRGLQPEDHDPYSLMPEGKMVVYHIGPKL